MLKEKMETKVLDVDNKNYMIIDEIELNNNKYCYLVNLDNPEDIVIRKYVDNNLVNLDSEEEFDTVISALYEKNKDKFTD